VTDLTVERLDAAGLRAMREEVLAVYRQVYADQLDDPFRTPERFWERLDAYASREGFGMAAGRVGGELVGFALGYALPARSRWWEHLRGEHESGVDFTREDGRRTFAFNELMTAPAWRGRGFAHALHDELLADRPEQRATLLVRPDNEPARSAYLRWGWRVVGTIQPFPDSPVFDALLRDLPLT
jgi:ribosomal protein S18 acetylase RimI-like enzyme